MASRKKKQVAVPEGERQTILLMFIRRCVSRDKEALNVYREVTQAGETFVLGAERVLTRSGMSKSPLGNPPIGGVYQVQVIARDDDGWSVFTNTATYVGRHHLKAEVAEWAALDAAAKGELDAIAAAKRDKKDDPLRRQVAPLAAAWRKAPFNQRAQLLARVVELITGGSIP